MASSANITALYLTGDLDFLAGGMDGANLIGQYVKSVSTAGAVTLQDADDDEVTVQIDIPPSVTIGTASPTSGFGAEDDVYLQVNASDDLVSIWGKGASDWTEYELPTGTSVSLSSSLPLSPAASASAGTATTASRSDHRHKSELVANSVGNSNIVNLAISTAKLQQNAVTKAKMATGTAGKYLGFDGAGNVSELDGPAAPPPITDLTIVRTNGTLNTALAAGDLVVETGTGDTVEKAEGSPAQVIPYPIGVATEAIAFNASGEIALFGTVDVTNSALSGAQVGTRIFAVKTGSGSSTAWGLSLTEPTAVGSEYLDVGYVVRVISQSSNKFNIFFQFDGDLITIPTPPPPDFVFPTNEAQQNAAIEVVVGEYSHTVFGLEVTLGPVFTGLNTFIEWAWRSAEYLAASGATKPFDSSGPSEFEGVIGGININNTLVGGTYCEVDLLVDASYMSTNGVTPVAMHMASTSGGTLVSYALKDGLFSAGGYNWWTVPSSTTIAAALGIGKYNSATNSTETIFVAVEWSDGTYTSQTNDDTENLAKIGLGDLANRVGTALGVDTLWDRVGENNLYGNAVASNVAFNGWRNFNESYGISKTGVYEFALVRPSGDTSTTDISKAVRMSYQPLTNVDSTSPMEQLLQSAVDLSRLGAAPRISLVATDPTANTEDQSAANMTTWDYDNPAAGYIYVNKLEKGTNQESFSIKVHPADSTERTKWKRFRSGDSISFQCSTYGDQWHPIGTDRNDYSLSYKSTSADWLDADGNVDANGNWLYIDFPVSDMTGIQAPNQTWHNIVLHLLDPDNESFAIQSTGAINRESNTGAFWWTVEDYQQLGSTRNLAKSTAPAFKTSLDLNFHIGDIPGLGISFVEELSDVPTDQVEILTGNDTALIAKDTDGATDITSGVLGDVFRPGPNGLHWIKVGNIVPNISQYATIASPAFTGAPTVPTPSITASDTQIANKKYVEASFDNKIWVGTKAAYDALTISSTDEKIYIITS